MMQQQKDTATQGKSYSFATDCVHVTSDGSDTYNASSYPIYQTATFKQESADTMQEFDYSRSGNPTRLHLETHLAKLMHASNTFTVSSGMQALTIILRLLKPSDEIISGDDLYGGTNRLLNELVNTTHHVDTTNIASIIEQITPNTRMVLLESPTNPLIKIADIRGIVAAVRQCSANCLIVVDNSMMSPYLMKTLDLGADIEYHSGTKYIGGHHDLMAGIIAVKDKEMATKIFFNINATGCALGPFECFLLMRGVKTLPLRMDKQQANAMQIAIYLENIGFKVRYPGLPSNANHKLHNSQSIGSGAVLSFETGSVAMSKAIVESVSLFAISVSFGCVNSLISMPGYMSHASIPQHIRSERDFPEDLVRICAGIEDCTDLIEDLESAINPLLGMLLPKKA